MLPSVLDEYQRRIQELTTVLLDAASRQNEAGMLLLGTLALAVVFVVAPAARRNLPVWSAALALPVVAFAWRRYLRSRDLRESQTRVRAFYERGVKRLTALWPGAGHTGEEYRESSHLYERDLSILGPGSLFELLSTARTELGRRRLAAYLLHPPEPEETAARQAAVAELRDCAALREELVQLGRYEFSECTATAFSDWLAAPPARLPRLLPALALLPAVLLTLLLLVFANLLAWESAVPWLIGVAVFQTTLGGLFQERVRQVLASGRALAPEVEILAQGLALLVRQQFAAPKLAGLCAQAATAPRSLRTLARLMNTVRERDREWLYAISLYLMLGTQLAGMLDRWRLRHAAQLRAWLDVWAEFEALNALACYAHEHPADPFPEAAGGAGAAAEFVAEGLGHPLLAEDSCVRNDVRLGPDCRFYLISGSNMAGKSTLLRSMGVNAVLARAGAPVRALRLRLSPLQVCASIGAHDSLLEGKSKFLAEVERIRDTLQSPAPVLFVIDEIFSGTNSQDRRVAAEAVVRALTASGAVGALSSHDLALTEIAQAPGLAGANVHLAARDAAHPLDFDYRLKAGVNRQSNALAIARLAGVAV